MSFLSGILNSIPIIGPVVSGIVGGGAGAGKQQQQQSSYLQQQLIAQQASAAQTSTMMEYGGLALAGIGVIYFVTRS